MHEADMEGFDVYHMLSVPRIWCMKALLLLHFPPADDAPRSSQ